ncbi:MAG: hypothetical protein JSU73_02355, partial [candidate division WOR-3 bacterium]
MHRLLKVSLTAPVLGAAVLVGCWKNEPPGVPSTPSGPDSAWTGAGCTFSSSAEDPDGDSVAIRFDWDDGGTSDWSPYVLSGETVAAGHSWADSGTYSVKAQARDQEDSASDWSAGHQIEISTGGQNEPPDAPSAPYGPETGSVDTEYAFVSTAADPDGDSVAIRFDWGDGDTSNWSSWAASGDTISMKHSWSD